MIGSSAVTSPLAGRIHLTLAAGTVHTVVNVRLAVRDDDDTNAAEALLEERDKAIARPLRLATGCIGG